MRRTLHLEHLERRDLLAADLSVGAADPPPPVDLATAAEEAGLSVTPEEIASVAVMQFESELASAFGIDDNNHAIRVGETLLAIERNGVRAYSPVSTEQGGFEERDYLAIGEQVQDIVAIGDRVLIRASRPVGFGRSTTVVLASIDADGRIHEIDRVVKGLQGRIAAYDGVFHVTWPENNSTGEPAKELPSRLGTIVGESRLHEFTLRDVIDPTSQFLPRESLFGVRGSVVAAGGDMGKFVLYGADGVYLIDSSDSASLAGPFEIPEELVLTVDGLTQYPRARYSDQGLSLSGELTPEFGGGYGSVLLDENFEVVEVQQEATGEVARLRLEADRVKGIFNDGRVPNLTAYRAFNSPDIRLVSEEDGDIREQRVSLPGARLGYRAFVLDNDRLVTVRAKTDVLLNDPSVDLSTAKPELTAYLMKRNSAGEFEVVSQAPLGDFDFRSYGFVSDTNTITLRDNANVKIIRVSGDSMSFQTLVADGPLMSRRSTSVIGFDTATMVTMEDSSALIGTDASSIAAEAEVASGTVEGLSLATATDVNKDGFISPLDVLMVINRLNENAGATQLATDLAFDVNGDGFITPVDALVVINQLNERRAATPEGEASPLLSSGQSDAKEETTQLLSAHNASATDPTTSGATAWQTIVRQPTRREELFASSVVEDEMLLDDELLDSLAN